MHNISFSNHPFLCKKERKRAIIPLLIHIFPAGCCCASPGTTGAAPAAGGAAKISANGLPSCRRSSEAFDGAVGMASLCLAAPSPLGDPPNKSTIGADAWVAGGDDRKGFVDEFVPPGDETLDCWELCEIKRKEPSRK